jgi:pimeloyl-ACP methyl ester carboxylesterase
MVSHLCFVPGDWLAPAVWEKFERHFKACGYTCSTLAPPPWGEPQWYRFLHGKDAESTPLQRLVDFYAGQLAALPSPPILIGHALGGLVVQLLLDRGIGVAGVAIASRPPQRVFAGWHSLLQILTAKSERLHGIRFVHMTPAQFSRYVAHPVWRQTAEPPYEKLLGRIPQKLMLVAALGVGSRLLFNQERGPLLLISGGDDRVVGSSVVLANYFQQRQSLAPTEYIAFPGYGHLLIMESGWERVADRIIDWLQQQLGRF